MFNDLCNTIWEICHPGKKHARFLIFQPYWQDGFEQLPKLMKLTKPTALVYLAKPTELDEINQLN